MPTGIQIFKPDGATLVIAPGDRLCKIIGSGWTNGARDGWFDVPEFASAPGWVVCCALNDSFFSGTGVPYVRVEGTQVRWDSNGNEAGVTATNCYLMWGIY